MKCETCQKEIKAKPWISKDNKCFLMRVGLYFGSLGGLTTALVSLIKVLIIEGHSSTSPTLFSAAALTLMGVAVAILSMRELKKIVRESAERLLEEDD